MGFLEELPRPFMVLAPMDDVTDSVFRLVVADLAPPDLYFTEFVNVDGLQSPGREKLLPKLRLTEKEKPIVAQLWGIKPDNFYKTAKELAAMGFDGVDLNFGCPVKKVVKGGACAALINNRELASEIIAATKDGAGNTLPVSVKTRVGFTTTDMGWIEFLLGHKLDLLSIHGRTAKEMSKVPANWELIGQARQLRDAHCPTTLIVGNGDVSSRGHAEKLAEKYKLDGIMIGRGIFHDPYVFAAHSPWEGMDKEQKVKLFEKHIRLYADTWAKGEYKFEALRKFCKVYLNGFEGAAELRGHFMMASNPQEALAILASAKAR